MLKIFIKFFVLVTITLQANDFKIENLKNSSIEYSNFPYFTSIKYPKSAENINTMLQYSYFEKVIDKKAFSKKSSNPFYVADSKVRNLYVNDYKVYEAKNYISISFFAEGCGAYCEDFTEHFNFDKYSGELIGLSDLFDKKNLQKLENKIRSKNIKKISYYLNKSKDKEEHSFYEECLKSRKSKNYYNKLDNRTSFLLSNNKLEIIHGRCSNHFQRPLDEIGDFVNTFTFKDLKPYLNEDAKNYLKESKYKLKKIKSPYKIWKGKIANKYPITLIYSRYGYWVYFYDKYKKNIDLSPRLIANEIILLERKYNEAKNQWEDLATFKLEKQNNILKGSYTRKSDSKVMSVFLKTI